MTTLKQIELESIFLISIVAAASLFFVVQRNNQGQFDVGSSTRIASINFPLAAPAVQQNVFSQISPDGTKKVIMKVTQNPDNTSTYDFSVSDGNDTNEQHIFTKTLDSLSSMSVPFNTWSPDDKYFFIRENIAGSKGILVFNALGISFSETEVYLEAVDIFNQKNTGNNFDEATGWASETLIIINTAKKDNTKGHSYWFEVPSRAVIQLSTEF